MKPSNCHLHPVFFILTISILHLTTWGQDAAFNNGMPSNYNSSLTGFSNTKASLGLLSGWQNPMLGNSSISSLDLYAEGKRTLLSDDFIAIGAKLYKEKTGLMQLHTFHFKNCFP